MELPHVTALDRAADFCGGITKLAAALGIGQSVVSNWKARGTLIEAVYCTAIEQLTKGKVRRKDLRPDDWAAIWPELATIDGPHEGCVRTSNGERSDSHAMGST